MARITSASTNVSPSTAPRTAGRDLAAVTWWTHATTTATPTSASLIVNRVLPLTGRWRRRSWITPVATDTDRAVHATIPNRPAAAPLFSVGAPGVRRAGGQV